MWRSIIRLAPLAFAGFRWWQRRQQRKKGTTQGAPRQGQQQTPPVPDNRLP